MYVIVENITMHSRSVVAIFPTYVEAEEHARAKFNIIHFEKDSDVDYDAADFLTKNGSIYSINFLGV